MHHKIKHYIFICALAASPLALSGCLMPNAQNNIQSVQDPEGSRLTVGTVQRKISTGMTGDQVAEALGAPNIVTRGVRGEEVWVYDKVSTQRAHSDSQGGIFSLILSGGTSGATSTTQKTLTIIIRFDKRGHVKDFSYNATQF